MFTSDANAYDIGPVSRLLWSCSFTKFVHLPSSSGRSPLSALWERSSDRSVVILPSAAGMEPESPGTARSVMSVTTFLAGGGVGPPRR